MDRLSSCWEAHVPKGRIHVPQLLGWEKRSPLQAFVVHLEPVDGCVALCSNMARMSASLLRNTHVAVNV